MADREPAEPKPTGEKEWARADTISPLLTRRMPTEISDGGGLGFAPEVLAADFAPLDPEDPAVRVLIQQLDHSNFGPQVRVPWRTERRSPAELGILLEGWRILAASDHLRLYGKGVPPRLLTIGIRHERGKRWVIGGISPARQLRASRGGLRASSFRTDPDRPPAPEDTVLRLLVVERTRAGGRLAFGRFQAPDLYLDGEEALLRIYINPLQGWQAGTRPWETPVLVQLPEPLGPRRVVDGAIYFQGASRKPR
jgi:hypothetical protein